MGRTLVASISSVLNFVLQLTGKGVNDLHLVLASAEAVF